MWTDICRNLEKAVDKKKIDWDSVEGLIKDLGPDINQRYDEEDTILSVLYGYVRNGAPALRITELFLKNGYNVSANNGFNGAACLHRLCWGFYDHYILPVAELLLEAGADCTLDVDDDGDDEEPGGVLGSIEWKSGDWMTGAYQSANIFEAYYQMVDRRLKGKEYKGIRSFRDIVGKTVTKVERISNDSLTCDVNPYSFEKALVFWCDGKPLIASSYIEFLINPYYKEDAGYIEDVSDLYQSVIGSKIQGLRFTSSSFATLSFSNGVKLSFMSAWHDKNNAVKTALCSIQKPEDMLELTIGMVIEKFWFTSGWSFSDDCRVYDLAEVFFEHDGGSYHLFSKGSDYGSHSLKVEKVPNEWVDRLSRTIKYEAVSVVDGRQVDGSVKWFVVKVSDGFIYFCVDTFEKIQIYKSKEMVANPLTAGNYTFDKTLDRIMFID